MRKLLATPLVSALLGGGVVAGVLLGAGVVDGGETTTVYRQSPLTATTASRGADALTAREIYKRDAPGVVFIRARTLEPATSVFDPYGSQDTESTGSGFVLDRDGRILTNAHVVDSATAVTVTFSDEQTREAKIIGKDESTDLALLKIETDGLELAPLELGDSASVQVGDPTIAIGNPFGYDRTLTTGVVSALQRRITAPDGYTIEDVIQTDAAINPGNSGGPLIDSSGRVIGINSQIATGGSGTGSVGIGFAVPIDTAKFVIDQLSEKGRVERPWMGMEFLPIDPSLEGIDPPAKSGLLVQRVIPGSPAARAGVLGGTRGSSLPSGEPIALGGDVVMSIGGVDVRDAADVRRALQNREPGDTVKVELLRGETRQTVELTLGNRPPGTSEG